MILIRYENTIRGFSCFFTPLKVQFQFRMNFIWTKQNMQMLALYNEIKYKDNDKCNWHP